MSVPNTIEGGTLSNNGVPSSNIQDVQTSADNGQMLPSTESSDTTAETPNSTPNSAPNSISDSDKQQPTPATHTKEPPQGDSNPEGSPSAAQQEKQEEKKPESPEDIPITSFKDAKISLPEGATINQEALESFGSLAENLKLTPRQAENLIKWQLETNAKYMEAFGKAEADALQKEWGNDYTVNTQKVLGLVQKIDRAVGDTKFSQAMAQCGGNMYANVQKGLLYLANIISEDSFGSSTGASAVKEEDALAGLQNALLEQRNRRI